MIKKSYFTPALRFIAMKNLENFCLSSVGTEDVVGSDPVDWDWDNA